MVRAVLVLLLVASGCSQGTKRVGTQPSWRGGAKPTVANQVGPVTFAPKSDAVTRYNEALQAPPKTSLGDAVIAAVKEAATKANRPVPAADARLFAACNELAEVVPEDGLIAYNVVEFALQRHGIIEPSPHLLLVWGNIDEPSLIIDQLRPRLAEILADGGMARVGVGVAERNADGTGVVVFAMQASGVATAPIPRSVPAGGNIPIDAVVESTYREPELIITREDGTTEHLAITLGKSGGFKANVPCGTHIGRQQVEITASDQSGSTVLANFPVWCGEQPPATITIDPPGEDNAVVASDEAERRLLALVNRDRVKAGLTALQWDDRVMAVSRAHSEDMKKTKIVAHISPTTGSASDRVRAAGIKTALVLENVARAYGVGEAHEGLMNSPGHRANVLSPRATHVGIGVVLGEDVSGRREMFVTEVFTRVPPKVDPANVVTAVHSQINVLRAVRLNAGLSKIAQQLAEGFAAGKDREVLWPAAKKQLEGMSRDLARFTTSVMAVAAVDATDGKELLGDLKPDEIGVGVVQGTHPQIGDGAIWIVVLMAERLKK